MAEFNFGVQKVHGFTGTGFESLTSNFEFVTIVANQDIRPFAQSLSDNLVTPLTASEYQLNVANASQAALDKLIQIVSERGQPVIMGNISGTNTVTFAIEHAQAWECVDGPNLPGGVPSWVFHNNQLNTLQQRITRDGVNVVGPLPTGSLAFAATGGVPVAPLLGTNGSTGTGPWALTGTVTFGTVLGGPFTPGATGPTL